jgi:hypothetical protein
MCERKFDKCMKDQCALESGGDSEKKKSCESMASIFLMGTKMMGCPAFKKAQKEACDCVPASEAPAKIRARLNHFLEKQVVGTTADENIDALLEKYKGTCIVIYFCDNIH